MRRNKGMLGLAATSMLLAAPVVEAAPYAVESHWAGVQLGLADVDVEGGDLDVAEAYSLELGRWFTSHVGLEMGLAALRDAKEDGADNRGTYKLTLDTEEAFVGPRLSTSHYDNFRLFVSGGLLHSRVKVEVEEAFYGLKPGGKASAAQDSVGYYVSGGITLALPGKIDLAGVIRYKQRPEAITTYGGDLDVSDVSVNLGAAYRF